MIHNLLDEPSEITENVYKIILRIPSAPIQNFIHFVHVCDLRDLLVDPNHIISFSIEKRLNLEKEWSEILRHLLTQYYGVSLKEEKLHFLKPFTFSRDLNNLVLSTIALEILRQSSSPASSFYPGTREFIEKHFPLVAKFHKENRQNVL